jgi:hypothetical protein
MACRKGKYVNGLRFADAGERSSPGERSCRCQRSRLNQELALRGEGVAEAWWLRR